MELKPADLHGDYERKMKQSCMRRLDVTRGARPGPPAGPRATCGLLHRGIWRCWVLSVACCCPRRARRARERAHAVREEGWLAPGAAIMSRSPIKSSRLVYCYI